MPKYEYIYNRHKLLGCVYKYVTGIICTFNKDLLYSYVSVKKYVSV